MTSSVYSITVALLKASSTVQKYARQLELREPAVSMPFYAASCWLKTAAAHALARKAVAELDGQVST
jgi:hypothetical protein